MNLKRMKEIETKFEEIGIKTDETKRGVEFHVEKHKKYPSIKL